jgi:hypothetical protein
MPKSQKPRKAHKQKPVALPIHFTQEKIEQIESMFNNVETSILFKLREGKCDIGEMRSVRDIFNITLFSMTRRQKSFADFPLDEISEQIIQAGIDTSRVIARAKRLGHVVCTGDEIESICDTLQACVTFCREQLAQCPVTFSLEVNAAKLLTNTHQGRITVSKKQIDWTFDQAMAITHMRPETQERLFADLTERARRLPIGQIVPAG